MRPGVMSQAGRVDKTNFFRYSVNIKLSIPHCRDDERLATGKSDRFRVGLGHGMQQPALNLPATGRKDDERGTGDHNV